MKLTTALAVILSLVVLFIGGLFVQKCSLDKKLAEQQALSTKADAQLITTTEQLAAERDKQAQDEAVEHMHAAEEQVQAEVQRAEGDSDYYEYLRSVAAGDGPGD